MPTCDTVQWVHEPMIDYLGNEVKTGDTVIISVKSGRTSGLGRGFVKDTRMGMQYGEGPLIPQVLVEWSNINKYWMPAKRVVAIPNVMLPEKRKERHNGTEEAVQPSEI